MLHTLFRRFATLLTAMLIALGFFGGGTEPKAETEIEEIALSGADITRGIEMEVPALAGTCGFNRISFTYACSAPVRAEFTYRCGVKQVTEELLLSSKNTEASMLIDGFLKRKTATRLISVRFSPIAEGRETALSVSGFTCALQSVPRGDALYMENEKYKAGVSLAWGGGLCYFEDKTNGAYGNLLNCHDTGRLVQQSYYGPGEIEGYENGVYGGSVWSYNPVQGGDMYGNASKLVALETAENCIRVVCRPLDWALNNTPTCTYYTAEYMLTETGLTANCTVVDFLQTAWPAKSQEIPAFYTLSALGTFVYYNGDAPWTGAPLTEEKELGFWAGEAPYALNELDDETWCAWVDGTGYGVGLYTPVATHLLAGRFEYDGTADPKGNATNYVAPLGVFSLRFDEPFTYTYYLTAGTVPDIRGTFEACRNAGNGV